MVSKRNRQRREEQFQTSSQSQTMTPPSTLKMRKGRLVMVKQVKAQTMVTLWPSMPKLSGSMTNPWPMMLELIKRTRTLYFETVLGKGRLDCDGWETLRDKCYSDLYFETVLSRGGWIVKDKKHWGMNITQILQELCSPRPPKHFTTYDGQAGLFWI